MTDLNAFNLFKEADERAFAISAQATKVSV